jgi:uroporphyrinogen-III synthase
MSTAGFAGVCVLALESRRSREIAQLIENNGGRALVVPSTREVLSSSNASALRFASLLLQDQLAVVIFMTGVGTRALAQAVEPVCSQRQFVAALARTKVVARGPKPVAVLREFGVPITLTVPEPNTWREILDILDQNSAAVPVQGRRVAVQEHGVPSPELYAGLSARGANVFPVHVYDWQLPENLGPLREAVTALSQNQIDVVLFTSSVQVHHLVRIAEETKQRDHLVRAFARILVASIGPVTSETLREYGIAVDLEPSHPKMGLLVKEAADQSVALLRRKQAG